MEARAVAKFVRVQPRKVRIIADEVRGRSAHQAANVLQFHPSKGARILRKVIMSAVANATENQGANGENLRIVKILVDEGPVYKRIQARAMGRANRIFKKSSHITVVVEETDPVAPIKPHGTKPKARPTLAKPVKKGSKAKAKKQDEAEVKAVEAEATAAEATTEAAEEAKAAEETAVEETAAEAKAEEATEDAPSEEEGEDKKD